MPSREKRQKGSLVSSPVLEMGQIETQRDREPGVQRQFGVGRGRSTCRHQNEHMHLAPSDWLKVTEEDGASGQTRTQVPASRPASSARVRPSYKAGPGKVPTMEQQPKEFSKAAVDCIRALCSATSTQLLHSTHTHALADRTKKRSNLPSLCYPCPGPNTACVLWQASCL